MKFSKYLAALALLAGCDGAADGYRYERTEFDRDQVAVTVIKHPTIDALRREAGCGAGQR